MRKDMGCYGILLEFDEVCCVPDRTSQGRQSSGVGALYVRSKQVCRPWKLIRMY